VLKTSEFIVKKYYFNTPSLKTTNGDHNLFFNHHFIPQNPLSWKHNLLPSHDLGHVQVEEVAVEDSLDNSCDNCDDIIESFEVVAVNPVEDVESAVGTESKQVMGGDGLSFSGFGHHEELGEDGHAFQIDGESPKNLHDTELMVQDKGEDSNRSEEEFHTEGVMIAIIGSFEFHEHQVDSASCAGDEENLHCCVVDANKVGDEVEISGNKHNEEENLTLAGDSCTGASLPYLEKQDNNCQ